jgi:hypothetical protein
MAKADPWPASSEPQEAASPIKATRPCVHNPEHGPGVGLVWDSNLRVWNAVQLQNLQLTVIHLHNRRNGICPAAAFQRKEDLLSGLMNRHVVNDDFVDGCSEERRQFLI